MYNFSWLLQLLSLPHGVSFSKCLFIYFYSIVLCVVGQSFQSCFTLVSSRSLVLISQYGFLHPRSGVNSGLTPAPCQLGFPVPYRLLQLIHFRPALEGRVSLLLFHTRLLFMCQTVPASIGFTMLWDFFSSLWPYSPLPVSLGTPIRFHSFPHTNFTFFLDFKDQGLLFPSLQSFYLF